MVSLLKASPAVIPVRFNLSSYVTMIVAPQIPGLPDTNTGTSTTAPPSAVTCPTVNVGSLEEANAKIDEPSISTATLIIIINNLFFIIMSPSINK